MSVAPERLRRPPWRAYLFCCVSLCAGKDVSDRWYDEVKQYNFNRPGFSSGTGEIPTRSLKSLTGSPEVAQLQLHVTPIAI